MITLITGQPGNGKTLFALWWIKRKAEREGRVVFQAGINELTLPWESFEAEQWYELPEGCIVVIDEAQFKFPRKPNGSKLPEYYDQLAVHRHQGKDIFIITQHPTLLDNFVRKLVGQHFHIVRRFGFDRATVYEWGKAVPAPENAASQASAIPMKWGYPKEVYGYYKSAEVHTVKKQFPMKIVLVGIAFVAVSVMLYFYVSRFGKVPEGSAQFAVPGAAAGAPGPVATALEGAVSPGQVPFDQVADLRQYAALNTPRVSGLPQTAPRYDKLTEPVRVPVPAACIQSGQAGRSQVSCKCFTQQGTPMAVEFNMCIEFARNGYFQDFDADRDRQSDHRAVVGAAVLADRADVPIRQDRSQSPVLAFAEAQPSPMQGARPPPNLDDGPPSGRPSRTVVRE